MTDRTIRGMEPYGFDEEHRALEKRVGTHYREGEKTLLAIEHAIADLGMWAAEKKAGEET